MNVLMERREIVNAGHRYQLGDDSKFYCTFARMDKICQVTASVATNGSIIVHGQHDHVAFFNDIQPRVDELIEELRREGVENFFDPWSSVMEKVFNHYSDVSHLILKETSAFHIRDARLQQRRNLVSYEEIEALLTQSTFEWDHYLVYTDDGHSPALIFTTNDMLHRFQNSSQIFINYTTERIPDLPPSSEFVILSIFQGKTKIPTVYILLSNSSNDLYSALWRRLLTIAPQLGNSLRIVSGEVSSSMAAAILFLLPKVEIKYSVLLYIRDITRRWNELHLHELPQKLLRNLCGIGFLPATKWPEAIPSFGIQYERYANELADLTRHIQLFWIPRRWKMCYKCIISGAKIIRLGEGSSNIYTFLENLAQLITDEEANWTKRFNILLGENHDVLSLSRLRLLLLQEEITIQDFFKTVFNNNVMTLITEQLSRTDRLFSNVDLAIVTVNPDNNRVITTDAGVNNEVNGVLLNDNTPQNNVPPNEELPIEEPPNDLLFDEIPQNNVPPDAHNGAADGEADIDVAQVVDGTIADRIGVNDFENDQLAEGNAGTCVVCLLNLPKVIVIPCFHFCLCFRCNFARQIVDNNQLAENPHYRPRCPVCRGNVESTQDVFVS